MLSYQARFYIFILIALVWFGIWHCLLKFHYASVVPAPEPANVHTRLMQVQRSSQPVGAENYQEGDSRPKPSYLNVVRVAHKPTQLSDMFSQVTGNLSLAFVIPVITLLSFHWRSMVDSGDFDRCFFNEMCRFAAEFNNVYIADFNHVSSYIPYIIFGVVYLLFVYWRQHNVAIYTRNGKRGLVFPIRSFYALGLCVSGTGLLSGVFHLCPSRSMFQYDYSMKYATAVVMLSTFYQMRFCGEWHSGYARVYRLACSSPWLLQYFAIAGQERLP